MSELFPSQSWRSVADAAEYWQISTKTVRRMISRGEIAAVRITNRMIRVDLESLDLNPIQWIRTVDEGPRPSDFRLLSSDLRA
jgi:excisionase family DNA binding protein